MKANSTAWHLVGSPPIHPFPARMAPEIALSAARRLSSGSRVLDPMAGSGTSLRTVSNAGHEAVGFDLDPLAVMIARAWTTPIDAEKLAHEAARLLAAAESSRLSWKNRADLGFDDETAGFVEYWFSEPQRSDLLRLAYAIGNRPGKYRDVLRTAFSRLIVTKDRGASLARDVSHSRPHRVRTENEFSVFKAFARITAALARVLEDYPPRGGVEVHRGDARRIPLDAESVDGVITSPPYLNAIDYMRAHRMTLVWLGYNLKELRLLRGVSVGAERGPEGTRRSLSKAESLASEAAPMEELSPRVGNILIRFSLDIIALMAEVSRVLVPGSPAVVVVGNSTLEGSFIRNEIITRRAGQIAGLQCTTRRQRVLPMESRYLPPPSSRKRGQLHRRMRTESVLFFRKS